jgi:hypothetical protein
MGGKGVLKCRLVQSLMPKDELHNASSDHQRPSPQLPIRPCLRLKLHVSVQAHTFCLRIRTSRGTEVNLPDTRGALGQLHPTSFYSYRWYTAITNPRLQHLHHIGCLRHCVIDPSKSTALEYSTLSSPQHFRSTLIASDAQSQAF